MIIMVLMMLMMAIMMIGIETILMFKIITLRSSKRELQKLDFVDIRASGNES